MHLNILSTECRPLWWTEWTWWRHQMGSYSMLLAFCAGNSRVPGEFPSKGQWRGALMFTLIRAWTNGWVNNRDGDDLRCHCAHYYVTVMNELAHGLGVHCLWEVGHSLCNVLDITSWRLQMETSCALLALSVGNSRVTGEFPSQRPVTRSFDVFFDLRLKNGWVNNEDAGDLRSHRAHYDVTVMWLWWHEQS